MQGGPCYDGRLRYHYMRNLVAPESPILMRQPLAPSLTDLRSKQLGPSEQASAEGWRAS